MQILPQYFQTQLLRVFNDPLLGVQDEAQVDRLQGQSVKYMQDIQCIAMRWTLHCPSARVSHNSSSLSALCWAIHLRNSWAASFTYTYTYQLNQRYWAGPPSAPLNAVWILQSFALWYKQPLESCAKSSLKYLLTDVQCTPVELKLREVGTAHEHVRVLFMYVQSCVYCSFKLDEVCLFTSWEV